MGSGRRDGVPFGGELLMFRTWRKRRRCFHHDNHTGESWVGRGSIIDYRKYYACKNCGRTWIK